MISPSISVQAHNQPTVTVGTPAQAAVLIDRYKKEGNQIQVGVFIGKASPAELLTFHQQLANLLN